MRTLLLQAGRTMNALTACCRPRPRPLGAQERAIADARDAPHPLLPMQTCRRRQAPLAPVDSNRSMQALVPVRWPTFHLTTFVVGGPLDVCPTRGHWRLARARHALVRPGGPEDPDPLHKLDQTVPSALQAFGVALASSVALSHFMGHGGQRESARIIAQPAQGSALGSGRIAYFRRGELRPFRRRHKTGRCASHGGGRHGALVDKPCSDGVSSTPHDHEHGETCHALRFKGSRGGWEQGSGRLGAESWHQARMPRKAVEARYS